MTDDEHNRKNLAVKRILQELKEMQENPSDGFMSLPLEGNEDATYALHQLASLGENTYELQFAIGGPSDSEFEGGIYHGRIQLLA